LASRLIANLKVSSSINVKSLYDTTGEIRGFLGFAALRSK
jgi:hypothetical protein